MNRARILLPLMAAVFALATTAQAVPTQLSANAGEFRDIKYASGSGNAAVVYAGSQGGGVFKSTDGGQTWAKTGLNTGYVWKIAVGGAGARVYAATDAGLFRTADAGATWTQLTFDPAKAVAVDPGSPGGSDRILAGVTGQGILRSTDNGATWSRQSNGLPSADITHIVFQSASNAYVALDCNYQDLLGTFGEGNWGGVYRTTNAGAAPITWTNFSNGGGGGITLGNGTTCVKALAANAGTVFAATYDPFGAAGGVYRSTGGGWTAPGAGPDSGNMFGSESLAVDRNNSNTIHAGARAIGVWSSASGGNNGTYAQKVDPTATESPDVYTKIFAIESIVGDPNVLLVAARGIGIMRSPNVNNFPVSAIDWNVGAGITADRVRGLANHATSAPNRYWMALEQGGVAKSENAGSTWATVIAGMDFGAGLGSADMILSATAIAADPVATGAGSVLVGTRGGGLLAINAGGNGWTTAGLPVIVTVGGIDHKPQSVLMPSTNLVYYSLFDGPAGGKGGGLMRSSTGPSGLAQTVYPGDIVDNGIPTAAHGSGYRVIQAAGNVAYYLRYDGLPYRSTDNFASNSAPTVNAPEVGFERLFFHDIAQNPGATSTLVGATNKGVYRSTDGGSNWSRVSITAPAGFQQVLASVAYVGANVYGVTRSGGLYCSTDNGTTWQAVSLNGLPPVPFRELKVLNNQLHVLTDGGGVYNGFAASCP